MCFLPDRSRVKMQRAGEVELTISAIAEARRDGELYASDAAGEGATLVALLELEHEEELDLFRRRLPA